MREWIFLYRDDVAREKEVSSFFFWAAIFINN